MDMNEIKAAIAAMKENAPYTYSAAEVAGQTANILEGMRQMIAGEVPAQAVQQEQQAA